MSDPSSDEAFVVRAQKGDEAAFALLMERYTGKLLRYGRRFLTGDAHIGDVVQDIFVTVYENIQDFDSTRQFSPWLYRIAHNAFIDVIRKKAKEPLYTFEFDKIIPHPVYQDLTAEKKEDEEIRVLLEKGIEGLSPAYREIITLHYYEDFSYKKIADILHIPIGTVGIRLSRAKEALKKHFATHTYE